MGQGKITGSADTNEMASAACTNSIGNQLLLVSGQVFGTEVQEELDDLLYLVEMQTKHMGQQDNGAFTHGHIISE